ncbi:hypothetical protein BJ166DRAFT_85015 [Pestalotiopsis sp. NC0098]|nr:hypothetical protein BJ166DRAFT_85015 [Pestalotiopsis sp. NC0098]
MVSVKPSSSPPRFYQGSRIPRKSLVVHLHYLSPFLLSSLRHVVAPNVGMPCEMRFGSHLLHTDYIQHFDNESLVVLYLKLLQPEASILELSFLNDLAFAFALAFTLPQCLLHLSFFQLIGPLKCSSPHWSCRNKLFPNVRSGFRLFLPLGAHMCTMLRQARQSICTTVCKLQEQNVQLFAVGRKHPRHYLEFLDGVGVPKAN